LNSAAMLKTTALETGSLFLYKKCTWPWGPGDTEDRVETFQFRASQSWKYWCFGLDNFFFLQFKKNCDKYTEDLPS
jgi:hypothetical protein